MAATAAAPPVDPVVREARRRVQQAEDALRVAEQTSAARVATPPPALAKAMRKEARRRRNADLWLLFKARARGVWQAFKDTLGWGRQKVAKAAAWTYANTKITGQGIWAGAKSMGRGLRYGVGFVGYWVSTVIGWAAKTVVFMAAGVAGTAIAGLDLAAAGVFWIASTVLSYWHILVIGTFLWLLGRSQTGFVQAMRERRRDHFAPEYLRYDENSTIRYRPGNDYLVDDGAGGTEWHGHEGLAPEARTPLWDALTEFRNDYRAGRTENTDRDFDFSPFIEAPDLEMTLLQMIPDRTAPDRAYFTGRLRFLREWMMDSTVLDDDRAAWAKVNKGYQPERREYPEKHLREGWNDMKAEIAKSRELATA